MALEHLQEVTEAEIAELGVVAAPNILTGTPTENKQIFDRLVAAMVAPKVNEVVRAANALMDAEGVRETQEEDRVRAEASRVEAEEGREAAEAERVEAEEGRVQAEASRVEAEEARKTAEGDRDIAEAGRRDAEAKRVSETEGVVALARQEADRAGAEALVAETAAEKAIEKAARAEAEADRAEEATGKTPYVGENGNWLVWNSTTGAFVDSGVPAKGDPGEKGEKGDPGLDGALIPLGSGVFAMGVSEDGHLLVAVNEQDAAPPLEINEEGHLVYKINN